MTLVVVKLLSSSSEVSLALCAIATGDQAVEVCRDIFESCCRLYYCIEVLATNEDQNLPYA